MIRGLESSASGLFAGQRRQEALTNNITNAETPGYKSDEAILRSFPEMLMDRIREGASGPPVDGSSLAPADPHGGKSAIGGMMNGVYTHEFLPLWTTGDLLETANPLDFAIARDPVGQGGERALLFFTLQDPQGNQRYTRNGRFVVNDNGQLATPEGDLVLDDQGQPVQIDGNKVEYRADGTLLLIDPLTGTPVNANAPIRLGLAAFGLDTPGVPAPANLPNVNLLVKGENGTYTPQAGQQVQPAGIGAINGYTYEVRQGAVEKSNVDLTKTMTQMMEVLRFYEANQRSLMTQDRTLEKAVNEIGRV